LRDRWVPGIAFAALAAGFALASAGDAPVGAAATGDELTRLRAELAAERGARERLEARLARLEADLAFVRDDAGRAGAPAGLDADAAPSERPEASEPAPGADAIADAADEAGPDGRGWFDQARLEAAGLPERDAADLRRLFEETELERLYLRDQATREGWPRGRLAAELAALDERMASVREDYGEGAYDWFLYAAGRANRVAVESVLGGSAAAEAGLRPGDLVYAYGGERIFKPGALVRSTQTGRLGETVELEVQRGGERLRVTVPRGPLGVRIGRETVEPPPVD
jgi:hypothetical protein